jgi:hypothetical protein
MWKARQHPDITDKTLDVNHDSATDGMARPHPTKPNDAALPGGGAVEWYSAQFSVQLVESDNTVLIVCPSDGLVYAAAYLRDPTIPQVDYIRATQGRLGTIPSERDASAFRRVARLTTVSPIPSSQPRWLSHRCRVASTPLR